MTLAQALPLATTWSMPGDGGMGTGWGIVMMIGMTLFWLAIIAIPALLSLGSRRDWTGRRPERPSEILDRRFAEGAVSLEDYEERRRQLTDRNGRGTERSDAQPPLANAVT